MQQKKNIKVGKVRLNLFFLILTLSLITTLDVYSENSLEGKFTNIKILDKISSKNTLIKLENENEY